jgi:tetratricopeptide (TPR) repeat protein
MTRWFAALVLIVALAPAAVAGDARTIAKAAYRAIGEHPFDTNVLESGRKAIAEARALDPNEAYMWLASGELAVFDAYRAGDWSEASSFEREGLLHAAQYFRLAAATDRSLPEPHIELAWIHLIRHRFDEAHNEYRIAQQIAPDNFRAWYGPAVCWWKQGKSGQASFALLGAKARAKTPRDFYAVNEQLKRMAEARGDKAEVERLLKEDLTLLPDFPQVYGNYALFLMQQNRLDEAIAEYERAIKLGPYPNAEQQLAEAKRRRDAAKR